MNALAVAVKPCWDVLAQTWDAISLAKDCLGACRELAPSKQESTTYEPSPVCKLLILDCRLLIPDRLLVTALRLLNEAKNIRELFRRRRPKKHRVAAHEVTARITFGAPTATARVSVSPPVWL